MKNRETNNSKIPNTSPSWGCFSRFLTPNTVVPSQTRLSLRHTGELTSLQVCSSLRINLGGSSGPRVARRTRQGEKKSLAEVLEKQETQLWTDSKGRAQHPAAASRNSSSVEKQTPGGRQNHGELLWLCLKQNREKLLLTQKTLEVCWAQQRGTELGAQPETWSRNTAPAAAIPRKSLNREIQSLNTETNSRWAT